MSGARREPAQDEWRLLVQEAIDLLTERKYGNPARSPGHNARLMLQDALAAAPTPPAAEALEREPAALTYTNWRGETAERSIIPRGVWFGSTDWHPEPQWLLSAFDVEKQADRHFALKDFGPAPPTYADAEAKGGGRAFFDGLTKGFITLTSGDGNPYIKISYRTLKDAQDAHGLLIAAIRSLASPVPKGEP